MKIARLIAAGVWLALPAATAAQDIGPVFDMGALTNTLSMDAVTQSERARAARQGREPTAAPAGRPAAAKLGTRFVPSLAVRKRNYANMVAQKRATDPKGADELQKAFAARDPIVGLDRVLAPLGLRPDDVVDATTTYLTTAWYATRGRDDTPTRAQVDGVRNQLLRTVGAKLASGSPAAKQEWSEVMLVQAMLIAQAVTAAKATPALRERVMTAVAQGAQATFGFDLRRMTLTAAGLRPQG